MSASCSTAVRSGRRLAAAVLAAALAACGTTPKPQLEPQDGIATASKAQEATPPEQASTPEPATAGAPESRPKEAEPADGQAATATEAQVQDAPPPSDEGVIDSARHGVRATLEWLARGVDSWFGDAPQTEARVTRGRLSIGTLKRQDESRDNSVRLDARVRLPNVERRTYLFFGRDNEREGVADTPEALSRHDRLQTETPEDRSFFAGVGLAVRRNLELRLGFRGIKPYAQARYRKPWDLSERDRLEFRQTFFWRLADRFGSTTALSYEHAYSATFAVRWLTAATITQRSGRYEWSSVLGGYKSFPGLRLLSLEAVGSGVQHTGVLLSDYGVQTKWLQPIYKDWLFGEVVVGHFWPRPDQFSERGDAWAVGAGVTMRF
jgi:hypothetical protein